MLEPSFWQFFGWLLAIGCLALIVPIALGNLFHAGMGDDDD